MLSKILQNPYLGFDVHIDECSSRDGFILYVVCSNSCGFAHYVMYDLCSRNVIQITILHILDGEANRQLDEQSTSILDTQIQETVSLDPRFYVSALMSCKHLQEIKSIHAQLSVNGLLSDFFY
ncbi:hypothetical protein L1887_12566 [Cichorium endivia]|nr:hypothetical protein L1887_12566 [Cichorium endivia]